MKELLLWIIGLQKINTLDSALTCALRDEDIEGIDSAQVLDSLLMMDSIEEAEKLARSSGGLRTIRALWYSLQLLKNLENKEEVEKLRQLEYPYNHLVKLGGQLDEQKKLHDQIFETDLEELEEEEEEEDEI